MTEFFDKSIHHFSLPRGTKLFEFEIERTLGHGGFGITYLATDTLLQEPVAIKEYLPNELAVRTSESTVCPKSGGDRSDFEAGLKAFLEEARLVARIRHTNVIRVRRFFEFHGTGYIVQDFEDGTTLAERLSAGPLNEAELRKILLGILNGLEVVHERAVLHRDLKPSNIMLRRGAVPVLIDFGAARDFGGRHSRSVTAIATPGYTPPEQFGIGGQHGPWTDLYALGAILYRCVTGRVPVDSLRRLRNDPLVAATVAAAGRYDPALTGVTDWMLRINESERPASVQAVRTALADGTIPATDEQQKAPSSLTIRPLQAGHVAIELDESVRADVLELAFFANPPGQYVAPAVDGKPTWRHQPHYFELYRTSGCPGRASFAVGPEIVNAIPVQSQVALSSADGYIKGSATWTGVPGASARPKRHRTLTALAALLLVAVSLASYALYRVHQREAAQFRDGENNIALLKNYMRDCRFCSFRSEAQTRIAQIEEQQRVARLTQELEKAGSDLNALQSFLKACGTACPDKVRQQAQASIDAIRQKQELARKEDAAYQAARGDATRLNAYLSSCLICAHANQAKQEIAAIEKAERVKREQAMYNQARGDVASLRAYLNFCVDCSYASLARQEINAIEEALVKQERTQREQRDYNSARGDISALRTYINTCQICTYRSSAQSEVANLERELQYFNFEVCNRTGRRVSVSVSGRKDPAGDFTVEGWWNFERNECRVIGRWARGWFYSFAKENGGNGVWRGSAVRLCVTNARFNRVNTPGYNCRRGERLEGFSGRQVNSATFTWTLNP